MKNTLARLVLATLSIALPLTVTSCDDDDNTTSNVTNNGGTGGGTGGGSGNSECLEGRTIQFIGTQTNTSESSTPIETTTTTTIDFDLTVEFIEGGTSNVTGVTDIKQISILVAGITTNSTAGLGPIDIDATGTYDCSEASGDDVKEATVIQDGITTTYTLTYTSADSGTFETTVSGTQDGVEIEGTSNGTFEEL